MAITALETDPHYNWAFKCSLFASSHSRSSFAFSTSAQFASQALRALPCFSSFFFWAMRLFDGRGFWGLRGRAANFDFSSDTITSDACVSLNAAAASLAACSLFASSLGSGVFIAKTHAMRSFHFEPVTSASLSYRALRRRAILA